MRLKFTKTKQKPCNTNPIYASINIKEPDRVFYERSTMNIITVTPNPALDVHLECVNFSRGEYNKACLISRDSGGKGINLSRALAANSIDSDCLMLLGKEGADEFVLPLYNIGMHPECVFTSGRVRENLNIHHSGGDTVIATSGPIPTAEEIAELEKLVLSRADSESFVCFAGSIAGGSDKDAFLSMLIKLKERGCRLVIDSKSVSTEELLFLKPYLIKPNEEEAELLTGMRPRDSADALRIASAIRDSGIENVMLTMGSAGSVLAADDGEYIATSPSVKVRSTVGAGDSSIAGFLAAKLRGLDNASALKLAMAYGAAACMSEGSLPPLPEHVALLHYQVAISKINKM